MASFQILSDLHLEAPKSYDLFDIPQRAPYLALLGDIGNVNDDGFFSFLEVQLRKFKLVFLVLGNHEPFHSSWSIAKDKIRQFADTIHRQRVHGDDAGKLGELVFLDQTRYDISRGVTVLGCTLHTRVNPAQEEHVSFGLNDFYYIKDWTVVDHCTAHDSDLAWLNEQVSKITKADPHHKIIIFTHHSPTIAPEATDPKHHNSPITSAFSTDLSGEPCWEKPQVRLWAFGHTHFNCDYTESRTGKRVLTNQRGYYFAQAEGHDPTKVIEV